MTNNEDTALKIGVMLLIADMLFNEGRFTNCVFKLAIEKAKELKS